MSSDNLDLPPTLPTLKPLPRILRKVSFRILSSLALRPALPRGRSLAERRLVCPRLTTDLGVVFVPCRFCLGWEALHGVDVDVVVILTSSVEYKYSRHVEM